MLTKTAIAILALATLLFAQAQPGKSAKNAKPAVRPLPPGETKQLQAVVMEVKGRVQWRAERKAKWQKAKKGDLLKGGAEIRTGWKSSVGLRVGMNASVLVQSLSRVAIARLLQEGKVFRTKMALNYGKADLKVDLVGLENDFQIATPSATLAIKGTEGTVVWNVVDGFRIWGARLNKLRAMEVRFKQWLLKLSKDDVMSESYAMPALYAYDRSFLLPIVGDLSENRYEFYVTNPGISPKGTIKDSNSLKVGNKLRGFGSTGRNNGNAGTSTGNLSNLNPAADGSPPPFLNQPSNVNQPPILTREFQKGE